MRASHQVRPETLLAAVGAFPAGVVILPPAVLTQEERPFQPPFLASTHRQSCSGTSRPGILPSGGLCSAHSRLASASRSRMEGFSGVVRSAYSWAFSNSSPRLPLLITPSIMPQSSSNVISAVRRGLSYSGCCARTAKARVPLPMMRYFPSSD